MYALARDRQPQAFMDVLAGELDVMKMKVAPALGAKNFLDKAQETTILSHEKLFRLIR